MIMSESAVSPDPAAQLRQMIPLPLAGLRMPLARETHRHFPRAVGNCSAELPLTVVYGGPATLRSKVCYRDGLGPQLLRHAHATMGFGCRVGPRPIYQKLLIIFKYYLSDRGMRIACAE